MIKKHILCLFFFTWLFGQGLSSRILNYNLLNYDNDDSREPEYRTILSNIEPDIILAVEVIGTTGFDHFLTDVLDVVDPGEWSGATFTNQSADQDIALFYKHGLFSFNSTTEIDITDNWGLRDAVEFHLTHIQTRTEIRLVGVHLKASQGDDNESIREAEAEALRAYLNQYDPGTHFLVVGDFNLYTNSEGAYQLLTGSAADDDGRCFDPINRPGNWHNNIEFAAIHTQSTRTTDFGGGARGGMDDRFDFILASESVLADNNCNYVAASYTAFGNDGNHFNQAINADTNTAVSPTVANAIHNASDHIPVYLDLEFQGIDPSPYKLVISEVMPNPNIISDSYGEWFEVYNADTMTIDLTNWSIKDDGSDYHQLVGANGTMAIAAGAYFVFGRNADTTLNGGFLADYEYSNFALANSADEIIILDADQNLVDGIDYTNVFPYGAGISMYLKNIYYDNNQDSSWAASGIAYGDGNNLGSPGWAENDSLNIAENGSLPADFTLYQNFPNPFNTATMFNYRLYKRSFVKLTVYDLNGREIAILTNEVKPSGLHSISWDASAVASGIYLYQLRTGGNVITRKLLIVK